MNYQVPTDFQNLETDSHPCSAHFDHGRETDEPDDRKIAPDEIYPPHSNPLRLTATGRSLEARANKVQMLLHPRRTRLSPPTAGNRIYSDAELALATEMFHKLKRGEDRRPRAKASSDFTTGPVDPLDRVADVLLDLFEL